jgi:hypothetical protein
MSKDQQKVKAGKAGAAKSPWGKFQVLLPKEQRRELARIESEAKSMQRAMRER